MSEITKKQLEITLSKLDVLKTPKEGLEQYTIPSSLAAEIIHIARMSGDISGKTVFDLGCGTGRLAIGAMLSGAARVVGVDIDEESLNLARANSNRLNADIEWIKADVDDFSGECDTVLQNPPFGMRGKKNADRVFLKKALECGKKVYSLHRGGYENEISGKSRKFLSRFVEENGGRVVQIKEFKFDIPYMFKFHKKPKVSYNVDLFVIEKV